MSALDIPAIRAAYPLSAVVSASVKLRRAGREMVGCCPFHDDRSPSFYVSDEKGFYHCFGCGVHGDVLDFVQAVEGVGLREAASRLGSSQLPAQSSRRREVDETEADRTPEALAIWRAAAPIGGTPADSYLRARGLDCGLPESLRFARLRYGKRGPEHPCLVALVASVDNRAVGIHRIYLNASGTGKAPVPKPKLSLGRVRGCAVRLAPAAAEMIVAEGIEDALTLQQELRTAAWAAAGAGLLRSLELPAGVRSVIIGADRDDAGQAAAKEAARRFAAEGRQARIILPLPGHKDFNSELQGFAS